MPQDDSGNQHSVREALLDFEGSSCYAEAKALWSWFDTEF
jgi:hypothetical protein